MSALDSADRVAWREANRGFIARAYPIERTRAHLEASVPLDRDRWRQACEMGWIAGLLSPEHGGLGGGPELFADLCEELGRGLVGDPVAGCALSASVIADDPSLAPGSILGELVDGSACCAWCVAEDAQPWTAGGVSLEFIERAGAFRLSGFTSGVLDADVADQLLVSARREGSLCNVLVPADAAGVHITRARGLDLTRSICRVEFDDVPVAPPDGWDEAASAAAVSRGILLGGLLVCADAIGAAERLMEMTVGYALQREVFGRVLATYQAVKHKCADMLCGIDGSRVALSEAARTLADAYGAGASGGFGAAARSGHVLKSFAGERCSWIAGEALQLHGGIGFTWEHDLHLYLRRIKADQALFGPVAWHRDALGRAAVEDALMTG